MAKWSCTIQAACAHHEDPAKELEMNRKQNKKFVSIEEEYTTTMVILKTAGLSIIGLLLVVLFSYSVVSLESLHSFSPTIDALFSSENGVFYWNIATLALLLVL